MAKIMLTKDGYLFDQENGTEATPVKVWLEKSKANPTHPEGKPWIVLPTGNITNRKYVSEDLFIATAVDNELTIDVKDAPARVLGTSGVKKVIIKYLSDDEAVEYTDLVNAALEEFKGQKGQCKKKIEDMSIEELQAYIEARKTGQKPAQGGRKTFIECFSQEDYDRYNELLAIATENKANAPKATRKPLTDEEKAARKEKAAQKEISAAEALLAKLLASVSQ